MRAWLLRDFTGLSGLELEADVPTPTPADDEVVVRVRFAALNPADRFLSERLYPANPPLPHILGRDGSGVVVETGANVKNCRAGDRVAIMRGEAGVTRRGTFAEFVSVPSTSVAPAPGSWSDEQVAAAPLVYATAHQALNQWGPLKQPIVLITGVSGGVGLATLQLAKCYGCKVIGTSRGASKQAGLKEFGVDLLVDPEDPELRAKVRDFTGKKGVDLVVDNIAGPLFNVVLDTLGYGGRISVVGMLGGLVPSFNTAKLIFKRIRIGGVHVSDATPEESQRIWTEVVTQLDAGGQRPQVDSVFPFAGLKDAFARLAAGPFGKVLISTEK